MDNSTPHSDRSRLRISSLFVFLAVVAALAVVGCDSERKSRASGGGEGAAAGGGGGGGGAGGGAAYGGGGGGAGGGAGVPQGHVMPGERTQTSTLHDSAYRAMRRTQNYLDAASAESGSPADQTAAAAAVKKLSGGFDWLNDPWGTPYIYEKTGERSYDLYSAGPDKTKGTADDVRVQD